jgi:hypothetical protein
VGSISTYNYELGFYSHKYDAIEGYNHTGLVRNHVDNAWFLFSNIRTEPTITVDLANASIIYDTLKLGNIIAYSGNTSTSTTTGAAVIYGGMGVGGNIYAAAIQGTPIGNGTASTGSFTTLNASGTITGAGQVVGYFNGAIGANTANTGSFTTVTASGNITAQTANVYAANVIGNTALYSAQYYFSNGVSLASTITGLYGNSNVSAYLQNANVGNLATGNLIPLANTTYYLGNSTNYFANAYANNFNAITQLATPKIQFTVGGSQILEDNSLDLLILGPYQVSIKPNGSYQYTFGNDGRITGPGGTFVYANGALYGNLIGTGAYWSNGVSFASTITGTYSNSNVGSYLATYSGNLSAGNITANNGGQIAGYITGAIGANVANSGTFTTVTASGNITGANQVIGYFNGAIGANTANSGSFTSVTTSGNISAGNQILGYINGAIGANTANSGTFTSVTASGNITAQTANVYAANFIGNTALYGAQYYWTNGATLASTITGNYSNSNVASYLPTYTGALTASNVTTVNGGQIIGYLTGAIGANVANTGVFTTANVNGTLYAATINASTIGNSGATFTGASVNLTGNIAAGNINLSGAVTSPNIIANSSTTSTSSTTGALIVNGGVGVGGNIYGGANISASNSVIAPTMYNSNVYPITGTDLYKNIGPNGNLWINYNGYVANLIVYGNTVAGYQNLLVTNGASGQVGVKVAPNAITSGASFEVNSTDSIQIPVGTTAQRPSGAAGMIRYNSTTNQVEFYNNGTGQWSGTGATFTTVTSNQFTGDGSTVAFTLSQSATTNSTIVAINGVVQIPTTAYSVSGTTLTFTEAPLSTDIIDARVVVTTSTVTALSQANSSINVSDTGGTTANVNIVTNNTYRYIANIGTSGSNYFAGGQAPLMSNIALVQNTPTAIDTFSASAFRGAKYVIKVTDGTNGVYSMAEVIVVHNGTTPTSQIYGVVNTGANALATFSTAISSGNVSLQANTWSSTASATMFPTYMPL